MVRLGLRSRPMAIYFAFLAARVPGSRSQRLDEFPGRLLSIAVTNSDEFADAVLTARAPESLRGIGVAEHERITSLLSASKEMADSARILMQSERRLEVEEGRSMMERANAMFQKVKDHFVRGLDANDEGGDQPDQQSMLRAKYSDHDVQKAQDDEERTLDIARQMYHYEAIATFPECLERLFVDCMAIVRRDLRDLGLSSIEVVTHEKRNSDQDGYYKVVIVTNDLGDRVLGRSTDGIVQYPFEWDDSVLGRSVLGNDGKWDCKTVTPDECCNTIKDSVPNPDTQGNSIACHIFVPFGGIGNPRHNDRIIVNVSSDGRVHETPMIQ